MVWGLEHSRRQAVLGPRRQEPCTGAFGLTLSSTETKPPKHPARCKVDSDGQQKDRPLAGLSLVWGGAEGVVRVFTAGLSWLPELSHTIERRLNPGQPGIASMVTPVLHGIPLPNHSLHSNPGDTPHSSTKRPFMERGTGYWGPATCDRLVSSLCPISAGSPDHPPKVSLPPTPPCGHSAPSTNESMDLSSWAVP